MRPHPVTVLRFLLAAVLVGALVLCIGTLAWNTAPAANRELLSAMTGALILLCRDATRWAFPSKQAEPENEA